MLGAQAWLSDPEQRPPSLVLPRHPRANGLSVSLLLAAYSTPGTSPANRSFVGLGPRDPAGIYQAQVGAKRPVKSMLCEIRVATLAIFWLPFKWIDHSPHHHCWPLGFLYPFLLYTLPHLSS